MTGEEGLQGRTVLARSAAGMQMRAPRWLYDMRIPAGAITLLAGREGIGKSTITADLCARVTRGLLPGVNRGRPRGVGIVAAEDSWESVILPRLVAAGADLGRVYRLEVHTEDEGTDSISLPVDVRRTAEVCTAYDIALLQLDPIISVLHGTLDTHKDRDVRKALEPLAALCAETDVSALGLIHVNKGTTTDPLNSIMGSRAFAAVARSVLYCIADPDAGEGEDSYLFGQPKSNLGPKQPTVQYGISSHRIDLGAGESIGTSRVVWGSEDSRTIQDAMDEPRAPRVQGEVATQVVEWVESQGRTVATSEILAAFPDTKRANLDKTLERLVRRDKLVRPIHGHYALPPHLTSDTPSDTPSTPSEQSDVSDMSDDLDRSDTSDQSDRLTDVRTPVRTASVGAWADTLYDTE